MSPLNFRDLNVRHVAIVLLVTLLVLIGGAAAYDYAAVRRPVAAILRGDERVLDYRLVSTQRGAAVVEVGLAPVDDLMTAYEDLEAALETILGPAELVVLDSRSPETVSFLRRAQFVLYEAVQTGRFVEMQSRLDALAREEGLTVRVGINEHRLFLQVEAGGGRLYEVIERDTVKGAGQS